MEATVSLDYLWKLIQSLSPDNKRWLAGKLYEEVEEEEKQRLTPYTMEEINQWLDEAEEDFKAGRYLTAEEADKEVKEALPWLRTRPADRNFPLKTLA